jgi:lipid-A-disaccharide synthase
MSGSLPLFLSAGDPSGDIAGSHLIRELTSQNNSIKLFGLGGRRMKELGQEQLVESSRLAVLGFWEVAKKYLFFRRLMKNTVTAIKKNRPRIIVLIDYPGFNLRLAERIKPLGIPIIYYISPQVWAWGSGRIRQIKRLVDLMLLILPFEKDLYDKAGINNLFIGHYLLDDIAPELIKSPYNPDSNLITLLPGSRPQEVQRMLPTLLKAAEILSHRGQYKFIVAGVPGDIDYANYTKNSRVEIEVVSGKTRQLIADSRLVLTSSGTATLETGIIGRPMVIIYKTGLLTYLIARRLVKLDSIGLINITAGKKIVPELIQNEASPINIADEAGRFLNDSEYCQKTIAGLHGTTDLLGTSGAAQKVAMAIQEYLR